jgi:hypothetical protein
MPGPLPKDPARRARRNADTIERTVLVFEPAKQPRLPSIMPDGSHWPAETRAWWRTWKDSPLSDAFTATDWAALLETAVLHGLFWTGDKSVAGEIRRRVAKHGATAEDRARLRISFAEADAADGGGRAEQVESARERRGALTAVPAVASEES